MTKLHAIGLFLVLSSALALPNFAASTTRNVNYISVTNAEGDVKLVPMTNLDTVRRICEIRDYSKIDPLEVSNIIYLHKLAPIEIVPYAIGTTSLAPEDFGLQDLGISQLEVAGITQPTNYIVTVDAKVFSYLEDLRKQSLYENKYDDSFLSRAYLTDFKDLDSELKTRWCRIFADNADSYIQFIRNPHHPRMISEVRLETNSYDKVLLNTNVAKLKTLGYDSVLLRYDCSEDLTTLLELVNDLTGSGLKVYIVYVGLDQRVVKNWNPFIDPDKITQFLSALAPKASGMFLNWRGTSAHVRLLPIEFFNFLANTVRYYNSSIPLYGEVYYGRIDYVGRKMLVKTLPKNVNGVVINNMGYYGYNHTFIVRKLFQKAVSNWDELDKVCMVIGYQPYYASKHKIQNMTSEREYGYKKSIEKSLNAVDCDFVTMLHDGVDDWMILNGTYDTNDNIISDKKISQ